MLSKTLKKGKCRFYVHYEDMCGLGSSSQGIPCIGNHDESSCGRAKVAIMEYLKVVEGERVEI